MINENDSCDLSKVFISSERLKNVFTYKTSRGRSRHNAYAIYLFIDLHKKNKKNNNKKPIRITYKYIQEKFDISKSTVKRTLDYLSNSVNVIKRTTRKIKKEADNKLIFDKTELYVYILYDNLNELFKTKKEKFNFIVDKKNTTKTTLENQGKIKENEHFPNIQKCTYNYSNNKVFNLSIKESEFINKKNYKLKKIKEYLDIKKSEFEKIYFEINKITANSNIKITIDYLIKKINQIINYSSIQPKFYSSIQFIKYMAKVITNPFNKLDNEHIDHFKTKKLSEMKESINIDLINKINALSNRSINTYGFKKIVDRILHKKDPSFHNEEGFINYMKIVFLKERNDDDFLNMNKEDFEYINSIRISVPRSDNELIKKRLSINLSLKKAHEILINTQISCNKSKKECIVYIKNNSDINDHDILFNAVNKAIIDVFNCEYKIIIEKQRKEISIQEIEYLIKEHKFEEKTTSISEYLKKSMGYTNNNCNYNTWFNGARLIINENKECILFVNSVLMKGELETTFKQNVISAVKNCISNVIDDFEIKINNYKNIFI